VSMCSAGLARLICGEVAWWEAFLICGGAMLLGFLVTVALLKITGRWHG
jgi:hypothetical protein